MTVGSGAVGSGKGSHGREDSGGGGEAGGQSLRGGSGRGGPCPWLMDPRQLLHNLDQVVRGGLSLHSAAIIVLQQGKGEGREGRPRLNHAMAGRRFSSEATPLLGGPGQQDPLTVKLV